MRKGYLTCPLFLAMTLAVPSGWAVSLDPALQQALESHLAGRTSGELQLVEVPGLEQRPLSDRVDEGSGVSPEQSDEPAARRDREVRVETEQDKFRRLQQSLEAYRRERDGGSN